MQCSTQHFSMPTHCPAFLCRAIAQQYYSVPMQFSALPWPSLSRPFLGNSKPRPSFANHRSGIAEPLHNLSLPLLRFTLPCPGVVIRCHTLALLYSAMLFHGRARPGIALPFLCSVGLLPSTGSVHHLKPRIRRETYRQGRESHSRALPPM